MVNTILRITFGRVNKNVRTILQYLFFLGLGVLFAWLSLKNLDKEKIGQIKLAFKNARYWLIFPVFSILILSHYIRAIRWNLLIEPLGYKPAKTNSFFAVLIGYLVNMGVPRLGEVMKCTILSRYEKIPMDKLIGTVILERLIDALTLLLIFGITLVIQPHLYSQIIDTFFNAAEDGESSKKVSTLLVTAVLAAAVLLLAGLWMWIKKKTIKDIIAIARKIWKSVLEGIQTVQHLKRRKQFLVLTIVLWSIYLAGGYLGFLALRETEHYGIKEAFTVLSAGSIGMIASPGGIGAYAYLIEKTMQIYGLNNSIALAFGWLLWLAQTAVIVIGGLISFVALPFYNKKKKAEAA